MPTPETNIIKSDDEKNAWELRPDEWEVVVVNGLELIRPKEKSASAEPPKNNRADNFKASYLEKIGSEMKKIEQNRELMEKTNVTLDLFLKLVDSVCQKTIKHQDGTKEFFKEFNEKMTMLFDKAVMDSGLFATEEYKKLGGYVGLEALKMFDKKPINPPFLRNHKMEIRKFLESKAIIQTEN